MDDNRYVRIYDLKQKIRYYPEVGVHVLEEDIDLMEHVHISEEIRVVKQPETIAVCKRCKAILEFSCDTVKRRESLSKRGGIYYAITCPCCKSAVRVWDND